MHLPTNLTCSSDSILLLPDRVLAFQARLQVSLSFPFPKSLSDTSIGSWVSRTDNLMSSLAAETVMDIVEAFPDSSHNPFSTSFPRLKTSDVQEQDLKMRSFGFEDEYATKAGPSSAGLKEQDYFYDPPILEKGNNHLETSPIPLTPLVLDESHIPRAEGGWAGWKCVAGSWLVCMSLPLADYGQC